MLLYVLCPDLFLILWIGVHPHDLILIAISVELSPHKVMFQRIDILDSLLMVLAVLGGSVPHTWEARLNMGRA